MFADQKFQQKHSNQLVSDQNVSYININKTTVVGLKLQVNNELLRDLEQNRTLLNLDEKPDLIKLYTKY